MRYLTLKLFKDFKSKIQPGITVRFLMNQKFILLRDLLDLFYTSSEVSIIKSNLIKSCSACYENCNDDTVVSIEFINEINNSLDNIKKTIDLIFDFYTGNDLISKLVELPIGSNHCWYCFINKFPNIDACLKCSYGKEHGICSLNNSDYDKILKQIEDLRCSQNE